VEKCFGGRNLCTAGILRRELHLPREFRDAVDAVLRHAGAIIRLGPIPVKVLVGYLTTFAAGGCSDVDGGRCGKLAFLISTARSGAIVAAWRPERFGG
jgi:hypothetical protein